MYCQNCGEKVSNIGRFCEFCGKETGFLDVQPDTEDKQSQIAPEIQRVKLGKKQKIMLVAAIVLIVLGITVYKAGANLTGPEAVAKQYFNALSKADYSKAYNYLTLPDNELLTKECFIKYLQEEDGESPRVATFKINKVADNKSERIKDNDLLSKSVNITYREKEKSSTDNMILQLVKSGEKKFLLFDEWKVVPDNMIQSEWNISVPKGAVLFIDGKEIKKENIIREQSISRSYNGNDDAKYQVYSIKNIFPCEYEVKVTMQNSNESVRKKATENFIIQMTPDINLQNKIKELLKKHNEDWEQAMNTFNIELMKDTLVENSGKWLDILNDINTRKSYDSIKYTETLISISFGNLYLDDESHLRVETNEYWKTSKEDSNGVIDYESNPKWTYYLQKVNDKWLIYKAFRNY